MMKLHIGNTIIEGTVEEIRQYVENDSGEFTVSFADCDGDKVTQSIRGSDAMWLNNVIECFLSAYDKSGFCNNLSVTIHKSSGNDEVFMSGGSYKYD